MDEQIVALILRLKVNGRLPDDCPECLRLNAGLRRVLGIFAIALPGLTGAARGTAENEDQDGTGGQQPGSVCESSKNGRTRNHGQKNLTRLARDGAVKRNRGQHY